jgi:hypothetical protein
MCELCNNNAQLYKANRVVSLYLHICIQSSFCLHSGGPGNYPGFLQGGRERELLYRTYQTMKRKIQHDAINNQEDEDSSAYPVYYMSEENSDKRKKDLAGSDTDHLSIKDLENKEELAQSEQH